MNIIKYIKDCLCFMKRFPYKKENGTSFSLYIRNVLYINAQPKYLYGKLVTKFL